MRSLLPRGAVVLAAVIGLLGTRPATANAQKALVYCPVSIDATGCNAIVSALTGPAYPLGVDRGYDGTGGTVDLKTVDLFTYSVFVVPSLADDATSQPYAKLRDPEVVEHLKAALIGRIAMWSGSPDQGATNRAMKDALIQNLAGWAGASFATAKGPGLVALLDASASVTARYDWVRAITPVPVTSDPALLIYSAVRALDPRATQMLTSGAGPIAYDNMATFGFQVPNGAAGVSLDAVGQTGTTQGGQVVLLTMEAGNASGAIVRTDKDDYPPGMTVVITGSGWEPNEIVKLSLHMDPLRDSDTELSATADANGNFSNTDFAPGDYDVGVRFVLTAIGQTSGRRAQTTFTDGKSRISGTVKSTAAGNPPIVGATVTCLIADGCNQDETTTTDAAGSYNFEVNYGGNSASLIIRASASGFTSGSATVAVTNGNNSTQNFLLSPAVTPPTATNDSYSTNEDQSLSVVAPGVLGNDVGTPPLTAVLVTPPPASQGNVSLNANGGFTFNPAPDFNGTTSFTYRAQNSGGLSAPATVTITVNAVNDAPTFTLIASHTSNEDAGLQTVANAVTAKSTGPANESSQTLLALVVTNDNNTLFSNQPAIDGSGTLTYTAAANANGSAIVSVKLQDNGGTANGGVDATTKTFTITVTAVNDAPSFVKGADQTVNEDAGVQTVAGWATAISAGPADEAAQSLTFAITSNSNSALFSAAPAVAANGTLTYTPAPNANGTATIKLKLTDNGGTANGGIDASAEQTFIITVNAVNDAPSFTKGLDQTVNEDAPAQTVTGWATAISAGPADESGQTLTFTATNDNNALFSAQPSVAANGTLTYTAAPNAFGTATVTLTLKDNGGTANGGIDTSAPQTFTITVNAVNDAPSFTKGADQSVNEDAGLQTVDGWATAISAGPANESAQTLTFVVTSNTNAALFASGPAVAANGTLTYTPAPNASGSATIKVKLTDNGGTANGGVDASAEETFVITVNPVNDAPSFVKGANQTVLEDAGAQTVAGWATSIAAGPADEAGQSVTFSATNDNNPLFTVQPSIAANGTLTYTPAPNAYGSATVTVTLSDNGGTANGGIDTSAQQTFTITVTPVNDAPSFTKGADQTVNEDAGAQTVSNWATAVSAGPNESQVLTFQVSSNNPTLFSAGPSISATGTLTYTPAPNANGNATVTVFLKDDGGTANGGVDASASQTFTITVGAVNDAPSFTKGADQTINEDAPAQTVANWATPISAGPADEETQTVDFIVSNDNNALFSVQPAVAANGTLTYTAAPNAFGSATVTVKIHDDGGTLNGGVDTSAPQTFTITVNSVNDAPSFIKGADQTVNEDAGPQTVSPWATGISAGPTNESSQTVSFEITGNTNAALFSSGPSVASDGSLSYTPAANANGTATITVRIHDNGGTANGGVDVSATQSFVINVTAVNDAPTFIKGANQTVLEDAGAQTVSAWATAISAGPADEAGQTLTFTTANDNNALFSVQPSVATDGTLTYTPAANAYGSAIVTVTLADNGGTANGGVDQSQQTFTITVTPVNDAPSFTKGVDQTVNEDAGLQTVAGWATAISAGPNEASQAVNFVVSNDNNGLFSVQPAVAANGTLTYTPAANAFGTTTVTLRIHDDGGTANGGIDTSADQTFIITVNSVNDAPSFTKGADQTVLEDAGSQTVNGWATAISAGPSNESGQTVDFLVTNDNNALFSVQPTIAPNGSLTYTAAADAFGSATVTVKIHDDGGTANGGVDTSAPQTFTINITPVNDAPSFTKGPDQNVLEDAAPVSVSWATAISAGPANESAQAVDFVVTANSNPTLFAVAPAVAPNGTLTYTLAANANGMATITLKIHDNGGTANGGVDESATQTFAINVTAVNDAPSFTRGADQTVLEDAGAQSVAGWATAISAGPADEASQTLTFSTSNDNMSLFSVQPSVAADGTLSYTPAPNAYGSAIVTLTLKDNGGTANGGVDTSAPQTFTITVTPVNDEPSFLKGANQTVNEDVGPQTVAAWATAISAGPNEASQTVNFIVTNDNNGLFSSQPAVAANGTLTYTPAANAFGTANVTVIIHDDGGTDNGGDDTSDSQTFTITVRPVNDAPTFVKGADQSILEDAGAQTIAGWATAISAGPANESGQTLTFSTSNTNTALFAVPPAIDPSTGTLTYTPAANANGTATVTVTLKDNGGTAYGGVDQSEQTFVITITAVNDVPSFVKGADQTVLEDAGAQSVTGWATAISAGPADESGQILTFLVTGNSNSSLFSAQPAIDASGKLTYTPAANANGSATITIALQDNGGTANGGVDTSPTQTFVINVTAVNDAPSFVKGADDTVLEDSGPRSVAGWATAISAGPSDEAGQAVDFVVSNNNNALFSVQPAVAPNGTLTYTPAANAYGFATVTLHIHDNGGTANGGVDASATQTFTITITPVNDVPSFTKGADQSVNEDAGAQSAAGWATAISAGPNEASQAVDFLVSNSNNALFSQQPAIDASGKLTYTPAANANGSATVTVQIHDDGGTSDGGVDTSAPQTFTITVVAVNDVPSFTKGADQTVNEDAAAQTIAGWATAISAGPADESGQALNFIVTNDNNALFSVQPAVSATGQLTYTPAPNAFGSAIVTVKLHDDGGTLNGGVDTSAPQTITITVNSVNDVPAFTKGADQTVNEDAVAQTVTGWATGITAGPANESSQTVSFEITANTNAALFSSGPAVAPNGTLTYTLAANANGTATITLRIHDDGGTANGGVDVSSTQSFVINVNAVNDAPTYNLITSHTSAEDAGAQSVAALSMPSPGPSNESAQTLSISSISNNNNALFSAQPTINLSTGVLTYTAAPNANGTATVTVTVKDNGGTAYGGVDATTKTMTITITPVNDVPVINSFSSPLPPNAVNALVTATGSFTDNDLTDSSPDVVTAKINWGDGSTPTTAAISATGTTRSVNGSHTYTTAGVYTLTLTVTDAAMTSDTEIYQYVVVYDPNGGFVTGGGWIDSPAGACKLAACTTQTVGKANFGFVSKYKKGQSTPDGNTEFQFKAGDINFHSEVYEWLVVAGAKAQFKGTGTINGSGNYGFMLTAVDGQINGGGGADKFRIKIWDKNNADTVVYDNQMLAADDAMPTTLLGGGSINIQAK